MPEEFDQPDLVSGHKPEPDIVNFEGGDYRLPPIRYDSPPGEFQALSEVYDWGLIHRQMEQAHKISTGRDALVVVLDTGAPDHRNLPSPVFVENMVGGSAADRQGHHTHVAGIVCEPKDGRGGIGWAPECSIAHVKVLGDNGSGSTAGIANGVRKVMEYWRSAAGRRRFTHCIINMSLGGGFDQQFDNVLKQADEAGIITVAAAGNSGYQGRDTISHPGSSQWTIGVASYRRDGAISTFSSGGRTLDVALPGEQIVATYLNHTYRALSGTSMASPAAAGLIADICASRPGEKELRQSGCNAYAKALLKDTAERRGGAGYDVRFGWGIPKAGEAVSDEPFWLF